jgi:hypothetical protein
MSKVPFGMLSVKAGIDDNPKPTLADRIAGAKKAMAGRTFMYEQGGKTPEGFTMTGQYAKAVDREMGDMGSREFVMYEMPDGKMVKVFGNWNEYAAGQDEDGRDLIADEDYPIIVNSDGEYVLDEARHAANMDTAYERKPVERMRNVTENETFGQENRTQTLLDKLNKARGPRIFPRR